MNRTAKQLLYGFGYVAFFSLIGGFIYTGFFRVPASCVDGEENQGEQGVDCGGPCTQACLPSDLRPLEVAGQVRMLYPDRAHFGLLAKLVNPNIELGARSFEYNFRVYDESGGLIQSFSGRSFIYPGEAERYLLLPLLPLPRVPIARADLVVDREEWVSGDVFPRPKIAVQYYNTAASEGLLAAEGRIFSNDTRSFPSVTVIAIFYGQFGQIVGASLTELANVVPNEARDFVVRHPLVPGASAARTQVFIFALRP